MNKNYKLPGVRCNAPSYVKLDRKSYKHGLLMDSTGRGMKAAKRARKLGAIQYSGDVYSAKLKLNHANDSRLTLRERLRHFPCPVAFARINIVEAY